MRVARLLIDGQGSSPPGRVTVERCRQAVAPFSNFIPMWAATRGYFVEFNRAVPVDAPADGIAFLVTAAVHPDDAATVNQNVRTIRDIADTARELTGRARLGVAPLAVHFPPSAGRSLAARLVASWLVRTLTHATQAGITSITLAIRALASFQHFEQLVGRAGFSLLAREGVS